MAIAATGYGQQATARVDSGSPLSAVIIHDHSFFKRSSIGASGKMTSSAGCSL
jgi:hypothetical protein